MGISLSTNKSRTTKLLQKDIFLKSKIPIGISYWNGRETSFKIFGIDEKDINNEFKFWHHRASIILPIGTIFKGELVLSGGAIISDNGPYSEIYFLFKENFSDKLVDCTPFIDDKYNITLKTEVLKYFDVLT